MTKLLSKLDFIRGAAKALAAARAKLSKSVAALSAKVDAAHRKHVPIIRLHVGAVADAEAELRNALRDAPEMFVKPRTITEAGIKCGYQGHDKSLELPTAKSGREAIVEVVHRLWRPAEIAALGLISTVEVPNAEKLLEFATKEQLDELVKAGAVFTAAGDHIIVKAADAAVDKLVVKLLKAASDAAQEEAA